MTGCVNLISSFRNINISIGAQPSEELPVVRLYKGNCMGSLELRGGNKIVIFQRGLMEVP